CACCARPVPTSARSPSLCCSACTASSTACPKSCSACNYAAPGPPCTRYCPPPPNPDTPRVAGAHHTRAPAPWPTAPQTRKDPTMITTDQDADHPGQEPQP